jgi:hypothetical protein
MQALAGIAELVRVALVLMGVAPGWAGHRMCADKRFWDEAMARIQLKRQMLDQSDGRFQTFTFKNGPEEHDEWLREILADPVHSRAAPATIRTLTPSHGDFCEIEADTESGPLVIDYGDCKHAVGDKVEIFGLIAPYKPVDPHVLNPASVEKVGTISRLSVPQKRSRLTPKRSKR